MSYVVILNKTKSANDRNDEATEFVYGPFENMDSAIDFLDRNDYTMTHTWCFKILELMEPY